MSGTGSAASPPWNPIDLPDDDDPGWLVGPEVAADVFGRYREEIARANAIIAAAPLDAVARRRDPRWSVWGWPRRPRR
jgi:hypothetical protein